MKLPRDLESAFVKGKEQASKMRRRTTIPYTTGELNKMIDSVCHPLYESDQRFILLDGLLHALVEQDPPTTVRKFVRYNVPKIVKKLGETRRSRSR